MLPLGGGKHRLPGYMSSVLMRIPVGARHCTSDLTTVTEADMCITVLKPRPFVMTLVADQRFDRARKRYRPAKHLALQCNPTEYWQVMAAQGVVTGIGSGLLYVPAAALLPQYFAKRRNLSATIAAAGSGSGPKTWHSIWLLPCELALFFAVSVHFTLPTGLVPWICSWELVSLLVFWYSAS